MRLAIRVDAGGEIGTGHFMRCLTLADAVRHCGARVRFLSRQLPGHLDEMLRTHGYEFVTLAGVPSEGATDDLPHAHWLDSGQAADAEDAAQALSDHAWDWVVVDHYALDARWERALRIAAGGILAIDDLADRMHDCDLLLDQNLHSDMEARYAGHVPPHCELLLGPRYALLRPEFRQLRDRAKPRTGEIERVLIFFGGVDTHNYTARAIEALVNSGIHVEDVDIVIGPEHPDLRTIESACADHGFACHVQTDRMADLMASADLAIGAGGSASWERCCLGLPAICMTTAANQAAIVTGLQARGAIISVTNEPTANAAAVSEALMSLKNRPDHMLSMSRAARELVDGLGSARVCDRLVALSENSYVAL
jgi:UDP-2,4-diacetamido-2,4,6-trideoxy-beta-L-altropyranose hydrolase